MKLAVKTLVLGMCLVGASAAFANHQSVVTAPPIPGCSPGTKCAMEVPPIPGCSPGTKCAMEAPPIPGCSPGTKCR